MRCPSAHQHGVRIESAGDGDQRQCEDDGQGSHGSAKSRAIEAKSVKHRGEKRKFYFGMLGRDWREISAPLRFSVCGTVGYVDTRNNWSEVINFNKTIGDENYCRGRLMIRARRPNPGNQ